MTRFLVLFIYIGNMLSCQALRCWHCLNENSNLECSRNGRLVECAPSQDQCQNELRFVANGRYFKISKGCKQGLGCDNHRLQNELRTKSYQCEKTQVIDVCWCCCGTEMCNKDNVFCQDLQPTCDILSPPPNGIVSCSRKDGSLGTNCFYRCQKDYKLVGAARTTCVRTLTGATWSSRSPRCEHVHCEDTPSAPLYGSVACSDGRRVRSICEFSCEPGYLLIGPPTTTCGQFGSWINQVPSCFRMVCRLPSKMNRRLIMSCTNGNSLGSTCSFRCVDPFAIDGSTAITCEVNNGKAFGRWTGKIPKCKKAQCSRMNPADGVMMSCSNSNQMGSICTFSCPSELSMFVDGISILSGTSEVTCTRIGWSGDIPQCRKTSCSSQLSFSSGNVECSSGNDVGSVCNYQCNPGYSIEGSSRVTCRDSTELDAPEWDNLPPLCIEQLERRAGACSNYGDVANGYLSCSPSRLGNGTHWLPQTECKLICTGELYSPIGERSSVTCTSEGWIGQICCDRCLSTPRLDIVVLMDSSYANEESWEVSKSFVHDFALYITENLGYLLNFFIIPYAASVDGRSAVKAPDIQFRNYEELTSYTQSIPYAGSGDSYTGIALRYVSDEILNVLEEGSIPLVLIISNRTPADRTVALVEAKRLRDLGIHIRVVPLLDFYSADPGENIAVFEGLTGGESNSVLNSDSVETFFEEATKGIEDYAKYCEDRYPVC